MDWNWQKLGWPSFRYDAASLDALAASFLEARGRFVGAVHHLNTDERNELTVALLGAEAVATSELAGETIRPEGVWSSIRRNLGLEEHGAASPAESGAAELAVDLYAGVDAPLTEGTLSSWHAMMLRGPVEEHDRGRYRRSSEPAELVSGSGSRRTVDFEAPPSTDIPAEMAQFVQWFNRTAEKGRDGLPPLIRAGIAHLHLVCIRPFADGNGRIGRAVAEKALAQGAGKPVITGLSSSIANRRKEYDGILAASNRRLDVTDWLVWFAESTLEAQGAMMDRVSFAIERKHLLSRLRDKMNDRQEKALLEIMRAGPGGLEDGLSAGNYRRITGASTATATRDLSDLVEKQVLRKDGEKKWARYCLIRTREP